MVTYCTRAQQHRNFSPKKKKESSLSPQPADKDTCNVNATND